MKIYRVKVSTDFILSAPDKYTGQELVEHAQDYLRQALRDTSVRYFVLDFAEYVPGSELCEGATVPYGENEDMSISEILAQQKAGV